jgi:hypothetical protein
MFMKDHCIVEEVDAVLMSLNANKAFDLESHQYSETKFHNYGFGPQFINCFKTFYRKISAKTQINGHLSNTLKLREATSKERL